MADKISIEVLGPGCKNCDTLYDNVIQAVEQVALSDQVQVRKIKEIDTFIKMGVFSTPALVIDGKVVSTSRVLNRDPERETLRCHHSFDLHRRERPPRPTRKPPLSQSNPYLPERQPRRSEISRQLHHFPLPRLHFQPDAV